MRDGRGGFAATDSKTGTDGCGFSVWQLNFGNRAYANLGFLRDAAAPFPLDLLK
jgi:hypothetical protein